MSLGHFDWEVEGVWVVHLQGSITLGNETQVFRQLVHDTLDAGKRKILLNMAEVHYLDSSGLGELIAAFTSVKHRGGQLKVMKLTPRVRDIVQLTKVHSIIEVFPDEESAVRSFAAAAG